MQMTQSSEILLDAIADSGLLPESLLEPFRSSDEDVGTLAKRFVRERYLTPFQARVLVGTSNIELESFFLTERYKILEHLGAGGMGEVYLAEHLLLRRIVALKVIVRGPKGSTSSNGGAIERFFREARVVAALDHPNVVRVFDMDLTKSGPFLVMEYVDGTNLHDLIRRQGAFSVERAVDAVKQAATGLGHAHSRGLIHRDVKPGNMLLDRHGTVKVVDLGLASFRDVNENDGLTAAYNQNQLIGTADYVAPEQALDGTAADSRSDMYSLGATLYFLLASRPPFNEGSITQKLLAHQLKSPPSISEFRDDVPAELIEIVNHMMAKRPVDRPASMLEVIELLAPFSDKRLPPPFAEEMPKHAPNAYRLGLAMAPSAAVTPRLNSSMQDTKRNQKASPASSTAIPSPRSSIINKPPGSSIAKRSPSSVTGGASRGPVSSRSVGPISRRDIPIPQSQVEEDVPIELVEGFEVVSDNPPKEHRISRRTAILLGFGGGTTLVGGAMWYLLGRNPSRSTQTSRLAPTFPKPMEPVPKPPVASSGIVLTGSGSTFIKPVMDYWTEVYNKKMGVKIDYKGIGSGKGIDNMMERVSLFGGTDVPLTDAQLKKAKDIHGDVVHIPLALGAVAITYNLPDIKQPIRFTGSILADIYLGKIKKWNEEALSFCNPGLKLPDVDITVVYRSDSSGTTGIWTDYLSKISGEWESKVGKGTTAKWPVGIGAEKSTGVAGLVTKTVGAIGYVELTYALERNLKVGSLKNKADKYVMPTLESVTAAASGEVQSIPADLRFSLTNTNGEDSYPIAGCACAVLYANQPAAYYAELVKFLKWSVTEGQADLPILRFAPLPSQMFEKINTQLATIRSAK